MRQLYQVSMDTTAHDLVEADSPDEAISKAMERSKSALMRLTTGLYNPHITSVTPLERDEIDGFLPHFDEPMENPWS